MSAAAPTVKVVPSRELLKRLYEHLYTEINADVLLSGRMFHQFHMYGVKNIPSTQAFPRIGVDPELERTFYSGQMGQYILKNFVQEFFMSGSPLYKGASEYIAKRHGFTPNVLVSIASGWFTKVTAERSSSLQEETWKEGRKEEAALVSIYSEGGSLSGIFPIKRNLSGLASAVFQPPALHVGLGDLESIQAPEGMGVLGHSEASRSSGASGPFSSAVEAEQIIARLMSQRSAPR